MCQRFAPASYIPWSNCIAEPETWPWRDGKIVGTRRPLIPMIMTNAGGNGHVEEKHQAAATRRWCFPKFRTQNRCDKLLRSSRIALSRNVGSREMHHRFQWQTSSTVTPTASITMSTITQKHWIRLLDANLLIARPKNSGSLIRWRKKCKRRRWSISCVGPPALQRCAVLFRFVKSVEDDSMLGAQEEGEVDGRYTLCILHVCVYVQWNKR